MKTQACEQCAKRKVRCNREEPCSNCKRRRQDRCTYVETSPAERIKKLEALVRSLGGNPEIDDQDITTLREPALSTRSRFHMRHEAEKNERAPSVRSLDPVVLEEDGQQIYLESNAWQNWLGRSHGHMLACDTISKPSPATFKYPDVFQILTNQGPPIDLAQAHPPVELIAKLWDVFDHRVYPLMRICFNWVLASLRSACTDAQRQKQLTDAENAFIFSLYLISVVSLSEDECLKMFGERRSHLIVYYQTLCEKAIAHANLFCMSQILVIKAVVLYMTAGLDRLSTRSLWSLMGLVLRNAERLGIHRDGEVLGLSPCDTEDRRRLWWQLQHIDLFLAVRSGQTPLTLTADWDAKLPLNIEDEDIDVKTTQPPKEKRGLTNMSYCLYTSWVINHQRQCFNVDNSRFELSWQVNKSHSHLFKDSLIAQLEEGLNKRFLQYCDPIKPLDSLLQISARSLICGMRLRIMHPLIRDTSIEQISDQQRDELLSAAVNALEYNVALHVQRSIKHFRWMTKSFFPWQAFMIVIVEMSQQRDIATTDRMWDLMADLYSNNEHLSQLSEDRRCHQAAELVVTAWKVYQKRSSSTVKPSRPNFINALESKFEEQRMGIVPTAGVDGPSQRSAATEFQMPSDDLVALQDSPELLFDLDFQDIDWTFWNSID